MNLAKDIKFTIQSSLTFNPDSFLGHGRVLEILCQAKNPNLGQKRVKKKCIETLDKDLNQCKNF